MFLGKRIGAILLMAGEGKRFADETPKQFHFLEGRRVFEYPLETFQQSQFFDEIVLVCHPDWIDMAPLEAVIGGGTRQESSYLGLKAFQKKTDIVLIHDAVRPFVSTEILRKNIESAIKYGAVDTCIPTADTLVLASENRIQSIPDRKKFLRGQTPQTFEMDLILRAHEEAIQKGIRNSTDDCQLVVKLNHDVRVVEGDEINFKITTEIDFSFAKFLLHRNRPVIS